MDASESRPSPTGTGRGNEAATVVVATTPTPAPISEHSPAALPAPSSSAENITKSTSPALPPSPPPVPPRCLGARGYDGGFYDVGSFFVFRHGPQPQQVGREESPASAEEACGGDLVELFGASPASTSRKAATVVPSPLHFELLDGLWVRGAASRNGKGEVQGSGPEMAARAFVLLQRQVDFLGRALGCAGSISPKAKKARSNSSDSDSKGRDESEGAGESGADVVSGGDAGNGVVAVNGSEEKQQPSQQQQQQQGRSKELFALSNTDDNDSLQGLVCSGGSLWIGKFGLPPTLPGQDESEVVDLWPRKVARVVGGGGGGSGVGGDDADEAVVVRPLEGKPDAVGPLTVLKEENGGGDGGGGGEASEIAAEVARRAHELIVQALAELRPHVPPPSPSPTPAPPEDMQEEEEEEEEEKEEERGREGGGASSPPSSPLPHKGANGAAVSDRRGTGGGGGGGLDDDGAPRVAGGKGKAASMSATGDSEGDDTEEERSGPASGPGATAVAGGGGRRGRKRQRVGDDGARGGDGGNGASRGTVDGREIDGQNRDGAGGDKDDNSEEDEGEGGAGGEEEQDDAPGPDEMTVAAVRGSLLRNGSDADREDGAAPNPDREVEEWEVVVKKFIQHVKNLPPGTEQQELSLMFAAALDPTLVRMRAANSALVRLAEACCASSSPPPPSPPHPSSGDGVDMDADDVGDSDGRDGAAGKTIGGGSGARAAAAAAGKAAALVAPGKEGNGRYGFKVRLELEATAEGAPPPDGIAGVLRAVAATAAAVEAAARAEECVAHAGDTLGGLRELRLDYKRSLPPGPREPIQFIIAEEQARVLGYVSAHEEVLRAACEKVRAAGAKVGEAYRSVEAEAGWEDVKAQVDSFLVDFEGYCESLMPTTFAEGGILGVDLAAARNAFVSTKPAPIGGDDGVGGGDDAAADAVDAASAAAPERMETA